MSIIFHCLFCLKFSFTLQNHRRCFTTLFYHQKCCGIFHNLAFLCKMTAIFFLIREKMLLSAKILKTCVNNTVHRFFLKFLENHKKKSRNIYCQESGFKPEISDSQPWKTTRVLKRLKRSRRKMKNPKKLMTKFQLQPKLWC